MKTMEAMDIIADTPINGVKGGRSAQRRGNWRNVQIGPDNSYLTYYCWTHRMCAHPSKDCKTP